MQSGLKHTPTPKPSTYDLQRAPGSSTTRFCLCPALPVVGRSFLARSHRRAWSAPPKICTAVRSRNGQSGTGEELGEKNEKHTSDRFTDPERKPSCSHFYSEDFEVIARNLPKHKSYELKHMLNAFAVSLRPGRTLLSNPEGPYKRHVFDLVQKRTAELASTPLDDPRTINQTSLLLDQPASPSSSLRQVRCLLCMDTTVSRTCASCERKAVHEILPELAAGTDLLVALAKPCCNLDGHDRSSRKSTSDSDSSSSVDFLNLWLS